MIHLFIFLQYLNIRTRPKISEPKHKIQEPKHKIPEPDSKCRNIRTSFIHLYLNTLYELERVS